MPLLSTALIGLFSSALHFVGLCCLPTLYPTFAARYGDVSVSDSGGFLADETVSLRWSRLSPLAVTEILPPSLREVSHEV